MILEVGRASARVRLLATRISVMFRALGVEWRTLALSRAQWWATRRLSIFFPRILCLLKSLDSLRSIWVFEEHTLRQVGQVLAFINFWSTASKLNERRVFEEFLETVRCWNKYAMATFWMDGTDLTVLLLDLISFFRVNLLAQLFVFIDLQAWSVQQLVHLRTLV